ncbi:MAG TPA: T9SS type A sorting domain-containing protein [Saprospiraceae bacterium]|jgi:hypothetical protein|nr:T9SS type A sorting domain-containing protein [Saprospiraceae bacterium]
MRILFILIFNIFLSSIIISQPWPAKIWENPITGTNPNSNNPYTTGDVVHSKITVSGIGRGSGISGENANNRYNAKGWNTGSSRDNNDYFYFILTPNSNYYINFYEFTYSGQASGTGPTSFQVSSSIDGYTSGLGSPSASGATIDLSGSSFQHVSNAIEFRIYGWNASGGAGTFSINDFNFKASYITLPVTFSTVTATPLKNTTAISFSTASETNNDYFTIERSGDGRSYDAIGEIDGAGDSRSEIKYTFTDERPLPGINYYRIKQTDFDGRYDFSEVRAVRHSRGNLVVTPRTTEGRLQVVTDAVDYSLEVYNTSGQLVKAFSSLSQDQSISIEDLTASIYYIRTISGGHAETIRIVKM